MRIIGCDLHASQQSLAMLDTLAAAEGPCFPGWEFQIPFGMSRGVRAVDDVWPNVDSEDEGVALTVHNSLNNYGAIRTAKISHGPCGFQLRETN